MSKKVARYQLKIQDEAVDELDRIYSFICEGSTLQAKKFLGSLKKKILGLRDLPRRGTRVKLLEDHATPAELRFIEHNGYLIFYTIDKKAVIVVHITGPGQDWIRLLI